MPSKKFYKRKAQDAEKIAKERIGLLFSMAKDEFASGRADLANRYSLLANRLAMKVNLSMPEKYRKQSCKKCFAYLVQGKNASVRLNSEKKMIELKCFSCGFTRRWGYSRRKL